MLKGRKEWTIWKEEEICLLSPSFVEGKYDPSFPDLQILQNTDDFKLGSPLSFVLNEGDLLFVPGG